MQSAVKFTQEVDPHDNETKDIFMTFIPFARAALNRQATHSASIRYLLMGQAIKKKIPTSSCCHPAHLQDIPLFISCCWVGNSKGEARRLSAVSLDSGLESNGVGADDLADLLAVLVEEESGHGAHALLLGDLRDLVDVDLVEAGVGVVLGEPV